MGSIERADRIAGDFSDRVIKALVKAALRRCGNCARRIECSTLLLQIKEPEPIKAAALHLINKDLQDLEPSIAARAAARFLKGNCLGSCLDNRMPRCVGYWLTFNGCGELQEQTVAALEDLAKLPEEELAQKLEAIMEALGFSSSLILTDAGRLLLTCRVKNRYRTAISEDVTLK